ncbi:MAG TPA: hypothetical protein PLF13_09505 [candidate division Zixibacteria bacterium]|nr:hypothetical protein [candidate division Zixibacteria bacterium]
MSQRGSLTTEQIFAHMHRDLRAWNPKIPESPERLDPILRILMEMYAHQLSGIDNEIGKTWQVASESLIKAMSPECQRWPVPAYTVMRCLPVDPVVEVDPNTRFFYKERREGGHMLFFSGIRPEKIIKAKVKHILLQSDHAVTDITPPDAAASDRPPTTGVTAAITAVNRAYVAVEFEGTPSNLTDALIFVNGDPEALAQVRWSKWYPGSNFGSFYEDSSFCPGLSSDLDSIFPSGKEVLDWGGLRKSSDLFVRLKDSFVCLPEMFTSTWEPGPLDSALVEMMRRSSLKPENYEGSYYWIRIDLPPKGDRSRLAYGLQFYFDAMLVVNKNEMRLFKHTGGDKLVEIELPEDIESIVEISEVIDSAGENYVAIHEASPGGPRKFYAIENREEKLVMWFDYSNSLEPPPDSLTVTYSVTAGTEANGVGAGKIVELYENHPGLDEVTNLIPTGGAVPAKTDKQLVDEASARLRNRDRALSYEEIAVWAQTFDPRIKRAVCESGVQRIGKGVCRCIVVGLLVDGEAFHSQDEMDLLSERLECFLKSRSPVNTRFRIELSTK